MKENLICDLDDQLFILFKQLDILSIAKKSEKFVGFSTKKQITLLLKEMRKFALEVVLPTNEIGDTLGAIWTTDGKVTLPQEFKDLWDEMVNEELIAITENYETTGLGLPNILGVAIQDWFTGSNCSFMMYVALAKSVGRMIQDHGTEEQAKKYVAKLYSGEYGGTMCLTEPQAGSDVGAIETMAEPIDAEKGIYKITGGKMFITNGEHNLTKNIIHPVLARTPGAPAGTKGISLFLVPKILEDGTPNKVKCSGIEAKMGIHGNGTCSMNFDGATGYLLGDINKGMKIMFSLMNEARLMVALQGLALASSAKEYALNYARTRIQGRLIKDAYDPEAKSVAIINHPDVRRQLMIMKSYVEGMRSLLYWVTFQLDKVEIAKTPEEQKYHQSLVDVTTSLLKGVLTDRAFKICSQAMQVFGGVGYTKDYPVEQLLRDARIGPIYEGTNGIQALDFLFRQIPKNAFQNIENLKVEVMESLEKKNKEGSRYKEADLLLRHFEMAYTIVGKLFNDVENIAGYAHVVMDAIGDILIAWQLIDRANVGEIEHLHTMRFFMRNILPAQMAKLRELTIPDKSMFFIEL